MASAANVSVPITKAQPMNKMVATPPPPPMQAPPQTGMHQ